jgi:DNA-directed RNA polymerase subunit RPC12/RpoP
MAGTKDFQCPNCGSPLNIQDDGAAEIKCPYCGSAVIVPQELRQQPVPAPTPIPTPVYSIPQYNDEQLSKQISTVGKVATGIAVSTMIAPIVITVVVFCGVGAFVAFILFSVNSTIQSALGFADPHALQTSIAATLVAADIPAAPSAAPTYAPATAFPTPTTAEDTPSPTSTPVPFSTPFARVLFHDNFSTKKVWSVHDDSNYTLAYVKGGYRMFINENGGESTWLDTTHYKDINVAADVKYVAGPDDGRFGVICRVADAGFYSFEFSPNGWYAIEKYASSTTTSTSNVLAEGSMDTSNFNKDTIYHLRGDCVGHTLTLYMNDEALLQVSDSSYVSGGIGLVANIGSSGDLGVDVLFSNYSVTGK